MKHNAKDETGNRYGRLTVVGVSTAVLYYRLKKFGVEIALTTPLGRKNFVGAK